MSSYQLAITISTSLFKLKFFILSFHPENFSTFELRKLARQEIERIKYGRARFDETARALGCAIFEDDRLTYFELPENCNEIKKKEIENLFSAESIAKFNISWGEIEDARSIISYLTSFLGEKKGAA